MPEDQGCVLSPVLSTGLSIEQEQREYHWNKQMEEEFRIGRNE